MKLTKTETGTIIQKTLVAFESNCLREDDPDGNYAMDTQLPTRPGKGKNCHVIVRFDLTGIPSNATIVLAVFGIYEESARRNAQIITLHALRECWTRSGSSWNKRDGTTGWTVPGATYDNTPLGSFNPTSAGFKTFDVTSLVQDWVNATRANDGFVLVANTLGEIAGPGRNGQEKVNFETPYLDLTCTVEGTARSTPHASNGWPVASNYSVSTRSNGKHRRLNAMFRILSRTRVRASIQH